MGVLEGRRLTGCAVMAGSGLPHQRLTAGGVAAMSPWAADQQPVTPTRDEAARGSRLGDHDQAVAHCAAALTLYQRLGDRLGEAKIHQSLAFIAQIQRRYTDALGRAEEALRPYLPPPTSARSASSESPAPVTTKPRS
jgi:hypothetical protein